MRGGRVGPKGVGRVVGALSGGERSRVSLATALLGRPTVLVLDEPTVGLDPVLRAELWQTFHRLASEGSTSLVETGEEDLSRAFLALNQELWGVSLRVTWAIAHVCCGRSVGTRERSRCSSSCPSCCWCS
jgi:DNA repair exonuclease SbcCD ATPase subunit